jgi:hypothetical protein
MLKSINSIHKTKDILNTYLDRRKVVSIDKYESFLLKEKILSTNFSDYCNNPSERKSQFFSIFVCIFCWAFAFKFMIITFIKDSETCILFGDLFHLTNDSILINALLSILALFACLVRTIFIIGE